MANPSSPQTLTASAPSLQLTIDTAQLVRVECSRDVGSVLVVAEDNGIRVQPGEVVAGAVISTTTAVPLIAAGGAYEITPADCGLPSAWAREARVSDRWVFGLSIETGATAVAHLIARLR